LKNDAGMMPTLALPGETYLAEQLEKIVMKKIVEVEERDRLRNWQPPVKGDEIMTVCALQQGRAVGVLKKAIEPFSTLP